MYYLSVNDPSVFDWTHPELPEVKTMSVPARMNELDHRLVREAFDELKHDFCEKAAMVFHYMRWEWAGKGVPGFYEISENVSMLIESLLSMEYVSGSTVSTGRIVAGMKQDADSDLVEVYLDIDFRDSTYKTITELTVK